MRGFLLSLLLHLQSAATMHLIGLLVNVATVMIVALLFLAEALDEHIRLDKETADLEKEKESVGAIKQKSHASMAQPVRVIKLWQYRIINMFDAVERVVCLPYALDSGDPDKEGEAHEAMEMFTRKWRRSSMAWAVQSSTLTKSSASQSPSPSRPPRR